MKEAAAAGKCSVWFGCLFRRKKVDSAHQRSDGQQLAKRLSVFDLIAIGVGATIGAGVYIILGSVARVTGPAIAFSFLIAGISAALSAFCYAELACRCPSAGSAYHYSYLLVGEGVAWLIGWALILEYTLGGAAAARGISPNMALLFGGEKRMPAFLTRQTVLGIVVDPFAAILVFIETGLLCTGIKESSLAQATITTVNVGALVFIVLAGSYLGFKTGWVGYETPNGYFPFGLDGMLAGSAAVFFSYVGFDALTSTAEEVKNPQRDLPLGIGISLSTCCILYMLVSAVILGLVPYYALDPDTPISSAFASYGMEWAGYIITTGTVTALCAALFGSILPQPRVLLAMARDGLLPSFFADINKHSQVPVKSTVLTGMFIAVLAFFMDVTQLAGMVSIGTLLAFTAVAISVLVLRYVPPDDVPVQSSHLESVDEGSCHLRTDIQEICWGTNRFPIKQHLIEKDVALVELHGRKSQKFAFWSIVLLCAGNFFIAWAASANNLTRIPRLILCGLGGILLLFGLIGLARMDQNDARHGFGLSGGFICPFVPFLPAACILINTYLLINLGAGAWTRASLWLIAGVVVYVFYGRTHSSLLDTVNEHTTEADEIDSS